METKKNNIKDSERYKTAPISFFTPKFINDEYGGTFEFVYSVIENGMIVPYYRLKELVRNDAPKLK